VPVSDLRDGETWILYVPDRNFLTESCSWCLALLLHVQGPDLGLKTGYSAKVFVLLSPLMHMLELTNSVASQSTSGPYLSSDHRLSAKLVPTFADRGCHVDSAANPHSRNFDFLDRAYAEIVPYIRSWTFLSTSFSVYCLLIILSLDTI
jgi:hypothetical protein